MSTWTSLQNGVALNLWSPLTPSILYMKPCSASPSFFPPSFLPSTQLSQLLISAACHTELLSVLNPSPRSLLQPTNRLHFSSVVVAVAKFRQWLQTKVDQNETSFMFFMSSKCLYPHPKKKNNSHCKQSNLYTNSFVEDHEIIFVSSNVSFYLGTPGPVAVALRFSPLGFILSVKLDSNIRNEKSQ